MKIAMIFPGYGDQRSKMGKELWEEYPVVKKYFKKASEHLKINLEEICFSSNGNEINQIPNAYLSIFVLSNALYYVLNERGISPFVVAGYDTGQFAAICVAQGITFLDGLNLLKIYGDLYMKKIEESKFGIVKINGLTSQKLLGFLDNEVHIASYQSRVQHLVSGTHDGISRLKSKLINASKVTLYDERIGLGLNSQLMNPLIEEFIPQLQKTVFNDLTIPLISNVNGALLTKGQQVVSELIKLINSPIKWDTVVDKLSSADLIIGMGSSADLIELAREKYPNKDVISFNYVKDLGTIQELLNNKYV